MNISGIRPSDGFYEKNLNRVGSEISSPVTESKKVEEEKVSPSSYDRDIAASLTISEAGKAAARNIAKAVTNMERDTTIHRYQYFVQNKPAASENQSRGMENFTL